MLKLSLKCDSCYNILSIADNKVLVEFERGCLLLVFFFFHFIETELVNIFWLSFELSLTGEPSRSAVFISMCTKPILFKTIGLQYLLGPDDAVALVVGYVVIEPEIAVLADPAVRAHDGAILQPLLLAVLPTQCLVLEVPLWPLVSLDVVLCVGCCVPPSYLGTGHSNHHHLQP